MAKNNSVQITTPKGIANYPFLNEPDTKFNPDGEYKVNLSLANNEQNQAFIKKLEGIRDKLLADHDQLKEAKAKNKKPIIQDVYEENEDGDIVLKFKQKALIRTKEGKTFEKKVALFDRLGKPMTDLIGYGSTIRVCAELSPYYMPSTKFAGVTMRLVAVKVLDLKAIGGDDASAYGFGEEEEGSYEADNEAEEQSFPDEDESEEYDEDKVTDF